MLSATASFAARIDVAEMRGLERAQQCRQRSSCGLRREAVRAKQRERAELVYGRTSFHGVELKSRLAGPEAALLPRALCRYVYLALLRLAQA